MKKVLIVTLFALVSLALSACGGSGSSSHNGYAIPEDGYYVQTALYVNDVAVAPGDFEPEYIWVDGENQLMHYKDYDHTTGTYHHNEQHFDEHRYGHGNGHGSHHSGMTSHYCYNITPDSFETEETDEYGNLIRSVFTKTTQEIYEAQ